LNPELKQKDYTLKLDGKELDFDKTISEQGVKSQSDLDLVFKMIDITVEVKGKTISLNVQPADKVSTIEDKIKEKEGVEPNAYVLRLGGQELDADRTIFQSQVHAGTALRVDFSKFTVDIKGPRQTYH